MGSLAASLILCLHGIFDVPGHCVGLAWAAALLLAVSFRTPAIEDSASTETPSHFSRQCWRGLGLILSLTGLPLIYAELTEQRILPTVQVAYLKTEIKALYDANRAAYDEATRNNLDYESNLSRGPLHAALQRVNDGLKIAPLDPQLHCARGVIHLCVDGNEEIVRQEFAIERRLLPFRVNLPLEQTRFWTLNPRETPALWAEALRRAAIEETHIPDTYYSVPNTYRNILGAAGWDETLAAAAFELARNSPNLLDIWANQAPPSALDQQMTDLLTSLTNSNDRNKFFKIWQKRGSIERVTRFTQEYPEFGRSAF
jgi:hypothetical protein